MTHIVPLSATTPTKIGGGPQIGPQAAEGTKSFADSFKQAVDEINTLDEQKQQDAYALALGEVDDLAQVQINAERAQVAVQLMVQMRNKLLDSYSEIMRMNI